MPEFSQHGGMIQFVPRRKKGRVEVNLTAVQHAGLTLSSDLLKVATTVGEIPRREIEHYADSFATFRFRKAYLDETCW